MNLICKSCVNSGISINGEFCVCPAGKKLKEESARMTDQELKEIQERFQNRLKGSEEYSVFLSHHEPDIARLLAEVERLQKENEALRQVDQSGFGSLLWQRMNKFMQDADKFDREFEERRAEMKAEHERFKERWEGKKEERKRRKKLWDDLGLK